MARRGRTKGHPQDTKSQNTACLSDPPSVERGQGFRENPQAWLARQEFNAFLGIVEARYPALVHWFRAERNKMMDRLRAGLEVCSTEAHEDQALLEWAQQLRGLTAPARLVPKRSDTFGRWMWAAYYYDYISDDLRSCWKKGKLAVGINVLLANKLPSIFAKHEIVGQLRPSEAKLRQWAKTKSLDEFALEVTAHITGWRPTYVKRGIPKLRAQYDELVRSSLEPLPTPIPFLVRRRNKKRVK